MDLADPTFLERLMGVRRDAINHYGRLDRNGMFHILHAQWCLDTRPDLRTCEFSRAYDNHGLYDDDMVVGLTVILELYDPRPWPAGVTPDPYANQEGGRFLILRPQVR